MNLEEVKIELTNYCKRKCIHCSSDANTSHIQELNFEVVKQIIDQCANLKVKSIVLTGGEATEYKEIIPLVKHIKEQGIPNIKLYTMCEPTHQKFNLLEKLTSMGLTEIIYSLTIDLTTDKAITYENVGYFLEKLSKVNTLSFHYCLTTKTIHNLEKLDKILSRLDSKNFKNLSFLRYVEHGRGKDDLTLSSTKLKELKPTIVEFMNKYKNKIHLGSPFNILDLSYTPCTAGQKTMIIGFDGNAYPCDAMKYFTFLGSGGNIYQSTMQEIYFSPYFKSIRKSSKIITEECQKCVKTNCKGGCLAQKMLEIIKKENMQMTTKWYQENAIRTMNQFKTLEELKLNAYTGIIGEYGEFFDYMKKLYTHDLSEEKREEILSLAPKELGDLVWYLSASLAISYHYTLDEVYDYLFQKNIAYYQIEEDLIKKSSQSKDPLCSKKITKNYYNIDSINTFIKDVKQNTYPLEEKEVYARLLKFKKVLNKLDDAETKEEIVPVVANILLEVTEISQIFFNKNLSEILEINIEKLRQRYPEGFQRDIANSRIDANKQYKEEINLIPKKYTLTKTNN